MSKFLTDYEYLQVPMNFIKGYLREANGAYIKVYLYILSLAAEKKDMTTGEIALELNLIESDVINALDYWKEQGIIVAEDDVLIIGGGKKPKAKQEEIHNEKPDYDSSQLAGQLSQNGALSDMMQLAQEIFGRILTTREMESIYWFYDGLHFSPEAILLLLEYCVSKGKTSMNYIERVAVSFSEKGAVEADSVYEIIQSEEQRNGYLYSIRKVMGIADRALSQQEEKYLIKWKNDLGMSEEMVALAYEYCVMQTAKLSFPYMDKIIQRWNKQGIKDIQAAQEDNKTFKERKTVEPKLKSDYNDLENLTRGRIK